MIRCSCCGVPLVADVVCKGCALYDHDPAQTWHCFLGSCDGSACGYAGQCQGLSPRQSLETYPDKWPRPDDDDNPPVVAGQ